MVQAVGCSSTTETHDYFPYIIIISGWSGMENCAFYFCLNSPFAMDSHGSLQVGAYRHILK